MSTDLLVKYAITRETFRAVFTGRLTTFKGYRFHAPFRVERGQWYAFTFNPATGESTLTKLEGEA